MARQAGPFIPLRIRASVRCREDRRYPLRDLEPAEASALTIPDSPSGEPTSVRVSVRLTCVEGDEAANAGTRARLADEANRHARAILTLRDEPAGSSWLDNDLLDSLLADLARK